MTTKAQAELKVEARLCAKVASMQPGEECYLAPQMRITIGRHQHLVGTSALAQRLLLVPGSGANRWRKVALPG